MKQTTECPAPSMWYEGPSWNPEDAKAQSKKHLLCRTHVMTLRPVIPSPQLRCREGQSVEYRVILTNKLV